MFTPGASFDGVLVLSSLKKIGEVAVLLVVLEKQFFWFFLAVGLPSEIGKVKGACPPFPFSYQRSSILKRDCARALQQTLKVTKNIWAIASKFNSTGSLMGCIFQ
jgi:hypothetical protein